MKSLSNFLVIALIVAFFGATNSLTEEERKAEYFRELQKIDFDEVKKDIVAVLKDSKDFFPADYGHYGPFMVRMAWHCSGTYRQSDGEGGCEGARQRFEPERSWPDNTNLDKARTLLEPVKIKYGTGLSWGDLFAYTGTVALEDMGTPLLGFCAGRVDDIDGTDSLILGNSDLQREVTPCELDGNCTSPFGAALLEHIYVDAGGFLGNPDPAGSVDSIRDVFARMGMNDTETVALVGGGHTFGKTHGACTGGAGPSPREDPENPWPLPNQCADGEALASNVITSGFEGPWSTQPLNWSQSYFRALLNVDWEPAQSPAEQNQFSPVNFNLQAPNVDGSLEDTFGFNAFADQGDEIAMLVTDIAFLEDGSYKSILEEFLASFDEQTKQFAAAWYKLTTRDMGPITRCFGNKVPGAQEFQAELPAPFDSFPSIDSVTEVYDGIVNKELYLSDTIDGSASNDILLMEAAYLCASTHRVSDHFGGCNGGRIRQEPERSWPERAPLARLIENLVADDVSSADLIVGTGTIALQNMLPEAFTDSISYTFCPLRSDVPDEFQTVSETVVLQQYENKIIEQSRHASLLGLSLLEFVALQGRPRSVSYMKDLGYSGSYTTELGQLTNVYAKTLVENTWTRNGVDGIFGEEFVNEDGSKFITNRDFVLTLDDEFSAVLFELAADENLFQNLFEQAWTKVMNADRFDGPVENLCTNGAIEVIQLSRDGAANPTQTQSPSALGGDENDDFDMQPMFAGALFLAAGCCFVLVLAIILASLCSLSNEAKAKSETSKNPKELLAGNII